VLGADEMLMDDDWLPAFLDVRTKVWDKEFDTTVARALTDEEMVGLGCRMLEEWEL
jgi:hypothetical protein